MAAHRRPHPFVPTVIGGIVAVPAYTLGLAMGLDDRSATAVAVVAAGVVGLMLGSFARKPSGD